MSGIFREVSTPGKRPNSRWKNDPLLSLFLSLSLSLSLSLFLSLSLSLFLSLFLLQASLSLGICANL
jgi:hypothetical protein